MISVRCSVKEYTILYVLWCIIIYHTTFCKLTNPWNGSVLDQTGTTSFAFLWHHFKIIIFHRTWNYTWIIQINSISQLSQCFLSVLSHFHKSINKLWIVPLRPSLERSDSWSGSVTQGLTNEYVLTFVHEYVFNTCYSKIKI